MDRNLAWLMENVLQQTVPILYKKKRGYDETKTTKTFKKASPQADFQTRWWQSDGLDLYCSHWTLVQHALLRSEFSSAKSSHLSDN